jgi:lipid II:glycine glycyltransferase (peptidoglycan interpeptide bridge formation enzyme)
MKAFEVEVDQVKENDWSSMLDQFEDANIYQTWAYGKVRWGEANLSHLVLTREGRIYGAAQLRIVRTGPLKCGIAYLRWGPLIQQKSGEAGNETIEAMASALYDEYVTKRGLFLRILPNAFLDTERGNAFKAAFTRFDSEQFKPGETYRTLLVDLRPPLETIRKNLDQKWRNQLNRAEKNGLKTTECSGEDFSIFLKIFEEMVARKQFETSSDVQEFQQMQQQLPQSQRLRVLLCEHQGIPVAGLIGTAMGNTGIYLFGATSDEGMQSKGSYFLQWNMIQWMKLAGVSYYNLGGINPETNPGVYHFKQGMSGADVLYMPPLVACTSLLSSAVAKAGTLTKGALRRTVTKVLKSS